MGLSWPWAVISAFTSWRCWGCPRFRASPPRWLVCGVSGAADLSSGRPPHAEIAAISRRRSSLPPLASGQSLKTIVLRLFGPQPKAQPLTAARRGACWVACQSRCRTCFILAGGSGDDAGGWLAAWPHPHGPRHPRHRAEPRCGAADGHSHRPGLCAGADAFRRACSPVGDHDFIAFRACFPPMGASPMLKAFVICAGRRPWVRCRACRCRRHSAGAA